MSKSNVGPLQDLIYEKKNGSAWITINRPDTYNSLLENSVREMQLCITDAAEDPEIGAIVITGAGEKAFCSGGNVNAMSERTPQISRNHMRRMGLLALSIRTSGKPVIAAVNGFAVGAGHELHIMCDLTIAAEHAKFGQAGPKMGGMPVWGATQMLHRMVGEKKAREIMFMCKQYTAKEALDMGLINLVVPMSELHSTVQQWCDEINEKSAQSLRVIKLAMNQDSDTSFWASFYSGSELFSMHAGTAEYYEGTRAFVEKRKPDFKQFRKSDTKPNWD